MKIREITGIDGDRRDYYLFPKAVPPYEKSDYIEGVLFDRFRYHSGEGDMWPLTWAEDDMIYAGAGDNRGCPMNIWKIKTFRFLPDSLTCTGHWCMDTVNEQPVDLKKYCMNPMSPYVKPSGILDIGGCLYLSVEAQNYGDNPYFCRQRNIHGWIVKSLDGGKSFEQETTPWNFFEGRLSSCHFLQFGRGYSGARDDYVYAYFPCDLEDGNSYWENNDALLLGRVPVRQISVRNSWEFYCGKDPACPEWSKKEELARPVFTYYKMTGANHVVYNAGIKRYMMGNYSFVDENMNPRPVHQMRYPESHYSQLTLYEAPEPWGPWKLFYQDDRWGSYGDYQPNFPTKWMTEDGRTLYMVSSGSWDDYNFVVQKMALKLKGDKAFPEAARYFQYEL